MKSLVLDVKPVSKQFQPYTHIRGVHVLPTILTKGQIASVYKRVTINTHHGDEGHNRITQKETTTVKAFKADKPYHFPWMAGLIFASIPKIQLDLGLIVLRPVCVDANMQIYTLPEGGGIVPAHVDEDFKTKQGSALYSILIYLNDGYKGGETVFNGSMYAPKVPSGAGLLFRHNLLHEGLRVESGEKHVLKTDLVFSF
jgi:hypothetical protein